MINQTKIRLQPESIDRWIDQTDSVPLSRSFTYCLFVCFGGSVLVVIANRFKVSDLSFFLSLSKLFILYLLVLIDFLIDKKQERDLNEESHLAILLRNDGAWWSVRLDWLMLVVLALVAFSFRERERMKSRKIRLQKLQHYLLLF